MKVVKLRNGAEQDITTASMDHEVLLGIHEDHPAIFKELIAHCRTGQPFQEHSRNVLNGWSVLNTQGNLIAEMKNVALSMVEGDGDHMTLVNPVEDELPVGDNDGLELVFEVAYHRRVDETGEISAFMDTAAGPPHLPRRFYH